MGLPKDLLTPIIKSIRTDIAEIQEELKSMELRMVGGSLLIIYEGDVKRAREGLAILTERAGLPEVESDDDGDDEEEEEEEENIRMKVGPPYTVKLIDFAHTRIAAGEGPDQGVLLGVSTVLDLLDGRIAQIRGVS
jgi:inositol-polyphosphate multikinase